MSRKHRQISLQGVPRYLSLKKTSELLGVHPNTLRHWDASGRLPAVRYGSRNDRRFRRDDIEKVITASWFLQARAGSPRRERKHWPSYAVATVAIAAMVVRMSLMQPPATTVQAADAGPYRFAPSQCDGWVGGKRAVKLNLLPHAAAAAFKNSNSASIAHQPGDQSLDAPNLALVCSGFDEAINKKNAAQFETNIIVSLGATTTTPSEDVIVFSYSMDGLEWKTLTSVVVDGGTSNAARDGYISLALPQFSANELGRIQVKVEYLPTTDQSDAITYLDGMALEAYPIEPSADDSGEGLIHLKQTMLASTDEPVISVELKKDKILGVLGGSTRKLRSVRLLDPAGKVSLVNENGIDQQQGRSLVRTYQLVDGHFTQPGKYTVAYEYEENGAIKTVQEEFWWGVLVMNADKAEYHQGDTAHLGMGVLDEGGHTLCNADLKLEITTPTGKKKTLSTNHDTIRRSSTCGPETVTNNPDYAADVALEESGSYSTKLTATTQAGEYIIEGSLIVNNTAPFTITRLVATRIWPLSSYVSLLEITPVSDYAGSVIETVPTGFIITDIDAGGTTTDDGTRGTISWMVNWKAGETYTLGYRFDAPDISPAIFKLGPLSFPQYVQTGSAALDQQGWAESREWQIASDAVGSGAPTRLWMTGFENNTSTAGIEYTANVNTPTFVTSGNQRSGTYSIRANPSSSTQGWGYRFSSADNATGSYFRMYFEFTGGNAPAASTYLMEIRDNAGTAQAAIKYDQTNTRLQLCNIEDDGSCASPIGSSSNSSITTSTWYRLEVYVDFGTAGNGNTTLKARLDGTEFATSTTINWANGIRDMYGGILTTSTSADMFMDDVAINQDSTTSVAGEGYPGEGKIVYLRPNGNGSTAAWTANLNCAAADYTCVDEVTPNDTTDAVACSVAQTEDYTLTDATANGINVNDTIKVVHANLRQGNGSNGNSHNYSLVLGGAGETNFDTAQVVTLATATTWFTNDDTAPQNPPTTVDATGNVTTGQVSYDKSGNSGDTDPWTPTDLDSAYVRISTTDCAPVTYITTIWVEVEYVPAEGGRIWSSGFELQSTTADVEYSANVNSPSISTTTVRSGAASLRANPSATTAGMGYNFYTADSADDLYFRSYIRFTTLPDANSLLMAIRDNAATNQASIRYDNTNHTLELWNEEDGAQVGSDSAEVTTGVWYRVEMNVNFGTAATGDTVLEGKLDGTSFASASNVNWANGVRTLQLGVLTTNATADVFFDDVAINSNSGSTQNGYPGAGRIVHLVPNAAGDNDAWTKDSGAGCTTNSYDCVNDTTPNDFGSNDFVTSTTLNQIADWNLSAATGVVTANSSITLVQTGIRFSDSAATMSAAKVRLKDTANANPIESYYIDTVATTAFTNNQSAPYAYPLTAYTRPNLSTAWTISDLDSAQLGVRLGVDGGTNTYRVTTMWLLVEYSPPTITVSGSCKQFDQSTDCSNDTSNAIRVAINGTLQANGDATTDGSWSIPEVAQPANGDVVTVFIDANADSNEAVNVTVYDGTGDISSQNLYQRHLALGSADNPTITNANISQYDNSVSGDEDIFDEVDAGNDLTVDSLGSYTDEELIIASGTTFRPASGGGANVTTQSVELNGTWTADSNLINVAGDWVNAGTFTAGTSTLTINGTAGQLLNNNGQAINTLTLNNTGANGATDDVTVSGALDVNGVLTITDGDLQLATNDPNVTTADDVSIGASGFVTKADNGTATWIFDGTTAKTFTDSTASKQNLGLVTITKTNGTASNNKITLASSMTVDTMTVSASNTLDLANSGYTLTLSNVGATATVLTVSGTLTPNSSSTVKFSATNSGGNVTVPATTYASIQLSGNETYALGGNLTSSNALVGGITIDSGGATLDVSGSNYNISLAGSWSNSGTFTQGTGTVTMTGTGNINGSSTTTFNNLTVDGSGNTVTVVTGPTVSGTLTLGGAADGNNDTLTINTSITVTLSGTTGTTLDIKNSGTDTINGPGRLTYRSSTAFPTGGTLAAGLIVRYDVVTSDITTAVRTDYGTIEAYNSSSSHNGTVTIGNGTHTLSGNFDIQTTGTSTLAVSNSNNVAVNVTGNVTDSATNGATTLSMGSNTWTVGGSFNLSNLTTLNNNSGTLTMNGTGTLTSNSKTLNNLTLDTTGGGTITLANATHTVAGNLALTASGTLTAGTSAIVMTGSTKTIDGAGKSLYDLQISGTETLQNTDLTVSHTLTIDTSKSLTINNAARTLTLSGNSGTTLSLSGTLNGPGKLTYQNSGTTFPTGGTLASTVITRFDTVNGNLVIPARTDYGAIEAYGGSANARTVTLGTAGSQTITSSSYFYVIADSSAGNNVTIDGTTWDPTLNVGGTLDFTGTGAATEIINSPDSTKTWTVSGSIDFTGGTFTYGTVADVLVMNGSGTLTAAGNLLPKLTLSGTITIANETVVIDGTTFDMTGGTITAGTSEIYMDATAATSIVGGGNTLYDLIWDPSIARTLTVNTSDLTVSHTLSNTTNGTVSIAASRTLSLTGTQPGCSAVPCTISGSGTLRFTDTSGGPGTDHTITAVVRFDATGGNVPSSTVDARTYGGAVEFYSNVAAIRSITVPSGTFTFSSTFSIITGASQSSVLTLDTSSGSPTFNITGDLTFTQGGSATPAITAGSGTWTAAGNVNFSNGTFSAASGHTLVMSGTSKTLTSNGQTLQNLTLSGTITLANATHTVNGNLVMSNTVTPGSSTVTMTGTSNTITGGGFDLNNLTIDPSSAGTITMQTSDFRLLGSLSVAASDTLTINSGRLLSLFGQLTLSGTINGAGTLAYKTTVAFPTTGTISCILRMDTTDATNLVLSARTYGGRVVVYNNHATVAGTVTLGNAGSQTLNFSSDLYLDANGAANVTLVGTTWDPTINVTGNLDFVGTGGGTEIITAPDAAATWSVAGNVDFTSGTYTSSAETLQLNGSSTQTITTASQSLYNLTLTNTSGSFTGCGSPMTAAGIDFADGTTVTNDYTITTQGVKVEYNAGSTYVYQNVNWNGQASDGIVFRSSASSAWNLDINGTISSVSYVNVAYSDATATAGGVDATNGTNTDCNNNVNWTFVNGITVSGGCFTDETEAVPCTDDGGDQIKVSINGTVDAGSDTTVDGSWSFSTSSVPSSGAILVFYRDGEATASKEATTVVKYDGTGNIDLVKMYESQLVIGTDSGSANTDQTISVSDLDTSGNGYENSDDEDVLFDVTAGADLVVDAEANKTEQLYIMTGDTYRPAAGGGSDTTTENLKNDTSATITADNNDFYVSGNWSNSGTFSAGTGVVYFTADDTGNTVAGTLNGSSAFYKVDFDDPSGSDATWTIQDPIKVSAANNSATFVIHDGTVTLGNGTGDDLEVDGAMNIAITTGETGTFQTYTGLDQTASESITIDLNANSSTPSCANCLITVGANQLTGAGNFKIAKNVVLRLNPSTSGPTDTGIQSLSNGYIEIKGSQDATATSTATDSAALQETKTCATGLVSANDVHNGKRLRFTSGLAYGRFYDITDTIDQDTDCATNTDDSIVRAANDSADSTIASITTLGPTRKICSASNAMITANDDGIGRYLRDQTDGTFYLIVDSTNNDTSCSNNDSFIIYSAPDSFSSLATSETIDITDGTKSGDTFEVLDDAAVTGENGTACSASPGGTAEGYIYAGQGSKTLIQYALVCDLGRNASTKYGLYFENIDGSFAPNDGFDVRDAQIKDVYKILLSGSDNNSSANGLGIRDSDISGLDYYVGLHIANSSDNNYFAYNRIHDNDQGGIGCVFGSCGQNNVVDHNYVYSNNSGGGGGMEFYDNHNTISNNYSYNNPQYGLYINNSFNTISGNYMFGTNASGGIYLNGNNNYVSSNVLVENTGRSLWLVGAGNSAVSNVLTSAGSPLRLETGGYNVVYGNTIYTDGGNNNWFQNSPGNVFGHNVFTGNTSVGTNDGLLFNSTGSPGVSNNTFVGDTYDGFRLALYEQGSFANTNNRFINDQFGVTTANATGDLYIAGSAQAHALRLLNTTLNSSTEVFGGVSTTGAYISSRKHDQSAGSTKIWGEYASLTDIAETPQDEGTEQYNYSNALYADGIIPHTYTVGAGAGSEDTNLNFAFSSGSLGGDSNDYVYRVLCTASNCVTTGSSWNVYRNGVLLGSTASTGSTYTDSQNDGGSAPGVQFKIDDAGTDYTEGATYLFAAYKGSNDANQQKTITMMQDGDLYTNSASSTVQLKGQSYQTNTTNITRNGGAGGSGGYSFVVNGTIDADNYDFQYLGGTGQASGLDINSGATVTSLARGSFSNFATNVSSSDAFIDVDSSVISSGTPSLTIPNTRFVNGNGNASCNVNATGSDAAGYWEFTKQFGPFGGESNDCNDGAADGDPGQIKWTPPFLTFSISDTAVGFGSLSSSVSRFATANEAGADGPDETGAHTLGISTNGDYGYLLSYFSSATLTSGSNTINAATVTTNGGTTNSEQFAIGFSTDGSSTIDAAYRENNDNYKFVAGTTTSIVSRSTETSLETITAYYLGNIASITEAGNYGTTITYIVTSSF